LPPVNLAMVMGGLLVLILLFCISYIWRRRDDRNFLCDASSWLAVAMAR
jgi:hypothetical protein